MSRVPLGNQGVSRILGLEEGNLPGVHLSLLTKSKQACLVRLASLNQNKMEHRQMLGMGVESETAMRCHWGQKINIKSFVQSFSRTLWVMDVRAENHGHPHQKLRFSVALVMGRNILPNGRPGVRVRSVRGRSRPKSLCLCCFSCLSHYLRALFLERRDGQTLNIVFETACSRTAMAQVDLGWWNLWWIWQCHFSVSSKPTRICTAIPSEGVQIWLCACSYMAGHYPSILMTGHIGTNTPKFVPPRWGRPPFDPTQTRQPVQIRLCVWSLLKFYDGKQTKGFWRWELSDRVSPCSGAAMDPLKLPWISPFHVVWCTETKFH